jgi:hypothetical protein
MSKDLRAFVASSMIGKSESLPITMPITGLLSFGFMG